jgi:cobalt-precorrin-5B (C1)-methyltransferase
MVLEEISGTPYRGAVVTICVPGGAEMAKKTLNARLGLLGGISILGTTGIVKPYSTAAWKASVVQAIDVAAYRGATAVVLTTGGRTEQAAMKLFASLPEDNFIQMGDFVGVAVRHAAIKGVPGAIVVGMIGKLAKMAEGLMQTHARQGEVNVQFLADLAAAGGAPEELQQAIRRANTARHVWELCRQQDFSALAALVCRKAAEQLSACVRNRLEVCICMVDFDGRLLARYPATAATER